jgi:hypothetical protein
MRTMKASNSPRMRRGRGDPPSSPSRRSRCEMGGAARQGKGIDSLARRIGAGAESAPRPRRPGRGQGRGGRGGRTSGLRHPPAGEQGNGGECGARRHTQRTSGTATTTRLKTTDVRAQGARPSCCALPRSHHPSGKLVNFPNCGGTVRLPQKRVKRWGKAGSDEGGGGPRAIRARARSRAPQAGCFRAGRSARTQCEAKRLASPECESKALTSPNAERPPRVGCKRHRAKRRRAARCQCLVPAASELRC